MSPVILTLLLATKGNKSYEKYLHKQFANRRRHGEWFSVNDAMMQLLRELDEYCLKEHRNLELSAKWALSYYDALKLSIGQELSESAKVYMKDNGDGE